MGFMSSSDRRLEEPDQRSMTKARFKKSNTSQALNYFYDNGLRFFRSFFNFVCGSTNFGSDFFLDRFLNITFKKS